MTRVLHIDFETRSAVDLKKTGVYRYAEDESTDVWCASFAFDDEPVQLWTPSGDFPDCPDEIVQHVKAGGLICCHNSNFEMTVWEHILRPRYGWPQFQIEQFRCTMAMALAMSLPGSLENAAAAVGLDIGKDMTGRSLMLRMAKPRKRNPDGTFQWWDVEERKQRLYDYCKTDTEVERQLYKRLLPLRDFEQRLWWLDQRINRRGVYVDVDFCCRAKKVVQDTTARLNAEMVRVTDGMVGAVTQVKQLTEFVATQGVPVDTLTKADVVELLGRGDLPDNARRALELRQEGGKSSVSKIDALLNGRSKDGRAKGLLQYHAASTGRWAGRRFQPQNLKRPDESTDVDAAIETIRSGCTSRTVEWLFGPPLSIVGDCIRGMVVAAPGNIFRVADFVSIEGVVLPWLAGEQWKLDAFRNYRAGNAPDLYIQGYCKAFRVPLFDKKDPRRQTGKVMELACLGAETRVLTNKGVKRIVDVNVSDLLWDGVSWIRHQGLAARGTRKVIQLAGVDITPDHLVLTGTIWKPAEQLASDESTLRRALATGSANLPSSALRWARQAASWPCRFSARVAASLILSLRTIYGMEERRAAIRARRRLRASARSTIGVMPTSYPTMPIAVGCSIGSLLASTDATTPTIGGTPTTAVAASTFTNRGERIAALFSGISSLLKVGTSRIWNWIGATSTRDMSREISGLCHGRRTTRTGERCGSFRSESTRWKPVYDLANAGPRHRFTIITDAGPLLVHNSGYQGGHGAYLRMGATGDKLVALTETVRETTPRAVWAEAAGKYQKGANGLPEDQWTALRIVIDAWRAAHPAIKQFWFDLEDAAKAAVRHPSQVFEVGGGDRPSLAFKKAGSFLWLRLPSGRALCYPYPRIEATVTSWGAERDAVVYKGVDAYTRKWQDCWLYGGLLAENVTQAVARDLLAEAIVRCEAAGYPIVLHVHDEAVAETPQNFGSLSDFVSIMEQIPTWAAGCPVAADGWEGVRYKKA